MNENRKIINICNKRECVIKKRYFWLYDEILLWNIKYFNSTVKIWDQILYNYYYQITETPKCVCGEELLFKRNFKMGYKKFCSPKCSSSSISVINKKKLTKLEKYGDEN